MKPTNDTRADSHTVFLPFSARSATRVGAIAILVALLGGLAWFFFSEEEPLTAHEAGQLALLYSELDEPVGQRLGGAKPEPPPELPSVAAGEHLILEHDGQPLPDDARIALQDERGLFSEPEALTPALLAKARSLWVAHARRRPTAVDPQALLREGVLLLPADPWIRVVHIADPHHPPTLDPLTIDFTADRSAMHADGEAHEARRVRWATTRAPAHAWQRRELAADGSLTLERGLSAERVRFPSSAGVWALAASAGLGAELDALKGLERPSLLRVPDGRGGVCFEVRFGRGPKLHWYGAASAHGQVKLRVFGPFRGSGEEHLIRVLKMPGVSFLDELPREARLRATRWEAAWEGADGASQEFSGDLKNEAWTASGWIVLGPLPEDRRPEMRVRLSNFAMGLRDLRLHVEFKAETEKMPLSFPLNMRSEASFEETRRELRFALDGDWARLRLSAAGHYALELPASPPSEALELSFEKRGVVELDFTEWKGQPAERQGLRLEAEVLSGGPSRPRLRSSEASDLARWHAAAEVVEGGGYGCEIPDRREIVSVFGLPEGRSVRLRILDAGGALVVERTLRVPGRDELVLWTVR